jgi:hypothetical protein
MKQQLPKQVQGLRFQVNRPALDLQRAGKLVKFIVRKNATGVPKSLPLLLQVPCNSYS